MNIRPGVEDVKSYGECRRGTHKKLRKQKTIKRAVLYKTGKGRLK